MKKSTKSFFSLQKDFVGFLVSFLCALHCMALPLILSMAAFSGLWLFESHWVEWGLVVLSMGIALYAMLPSYRQHRSKVPLVLASVGFVLLLVGTFVIHSHNRAILNPIGGFLVALSHVVNWRLRQRRKS